MEDAYNKFIEDRERNNLRKDSIRNLKVRVGFLKKEHEKRLVSDVSTEQLKELIFFTDERSAVTADNVRRALSAFFSSGSKHKYCAPNPMLTIKPVKPNEMSRRRSRSPRREI